MHSINSDDSYSGEGYNAFGLKDYEVYSFIIANISAHKSDDVYFKFINWDDNCDFVKNLESKDDFLKKLDLIEIEHGIAVIPWGPSITGHWATMLVDLKTKELYVFDSTIQNFEDEQSKTEAFGVLSDEVKLINNEVQSEKAGTCGIWTLCACVEFSLYNNIHDIIDNNQKIKSEVLNKIACIGRNIVDFTREKIRYKNTDSRYSKEGHSYFCKGKQLGLM